MRYLKKWNLFESIHNDSEIRNYLNDVFLELTDDGYEVDIEGMFIRDEVREEQTGYKINIKGGKSKISDVISQIDHAIEYLLDICDRYWIDIFRGFNFTRIENIDELEKYELYNSNRFEEIVINFRK